MNISFEDFKSIVPPAALHIAGLHAIPRIHKTVVNQYCNRLVARSACTEQCHVCALHVLKAVNDVIEMKQNGRLVKGPYPAFTWKLKDEVSIIMDQTLERGIDVVRKFGEAVETETLDTFLEELDG